MQPFLFLLVALWWIRSTICATSSPTSFSLFQSYIRGHLDGRLKDATVIQTSAINLFTFHLIPSHVDRIFCRNTISSLLGEARLELYLHPDSLRLVTNMNQTLIIFYFFPGCSITVTFVCILCLFQSWMDGPLDRSWRLRDHRVRHSRLGQISSVN